MRFLGIDYGKKRIGIAISDPTNIFSISLPTLENSKSIYREIQKIVGDFNVQKIIIGFPLSLSGKRTNLSDEVDLFIQTLENKLKIPIIKRDERLTSKIAQQQIIESVISKKKRRDKSKLDSFSASIILQEYLDSLKYEKK